MSIFKADARWGWLGGEVHNIFYFSADGDGDHDMADDAGQWVTAMFAPLADMVTADLVPAELTLFRWDGTDWVLVGSDEFDFVGTGSTPIALPRQSAALVIMRTNIERCVGKKYIAGICEGFQGSGFITSPLITALGSFNTVWRNGITGTNGTEIAPGVWHAATAALGSPVGTNVRLQLSTQRRRKLGTGS